MRKIEAKVKRGQFAGTVLTPHRHADGMFVVSKTRFEKDYIRVADEANLEKWINDGYGVRMSNCEVFPRRAPSLIAPSSIKIRRLTQN